MRNGDATIDPVGFEGTSRANPVRAHPPATLVVAACAVAVFLLLPIAYLVLRAAEATPETWNVVLRARTIGLTVRTVGLAAAVTTAAVGIGVPLAWLTSRTDLPLRRVWVVLFALPLVVPSYVGAFAYLAAASRGGLAEDLFGWTLPSLTGFAGAFLVLTAFTYPYVYLLTAAGIRGLDPALEEAARTLGRSRGRTFLTVTLPLLRPSIVAGGLLVALYTIHDFGAVSLLRYETFTQAIFVQYRSAFDRTPAAILSLFLLALAVLVVVGEQRARGRARYARAGVGSARRPRRVALGRWRVPALLASSAVVLVALAIPITALVAWLIRGFERSVIVMPWGALGNSVVVSAGGALAAFAMSLPVAILAARYPGKLSRGIEHTAYAGYALPGLVVALAFVFFGANYAPALYQTLAALIGAYVVLFLPQVSEPLRAALLQLDPRIEEAGRTLGASRGRVFVRVVMPLIYRPALAGIALVFLTAMKELPATLLLRPTGYETLATRVWSTAAVGRFSAAAAPALFLLLVSMLPLSMLARRIETQEVRA